MSQIETKNIKIREGDRDAVLERILTEIARNREAMESAFPLNDRGKPDYAAHYNQHVKMKREENDMSDFKKAATLRLLQGVVGIILTLIGFGLLPALREFVNKLSH